MCRNVDVWAIGLILVLIAVVSEVRSSDVVLHQSKQLVEFTIDRAAPFSGTVRLPQLCVTRD